MKSIYGELKKGLVFFAAGILFTTAALALDLTEAKQQGLIGETQSGYLAVVSASSEVIALVNDINAKRRAHYQSIATKNGIATADVEMLAGQKAIEKTPPGQYVRKAGQWQKK